MTEKKDKIFKKKKEFKRKQKVRTWTCKCAKTLYSLLMI